MNIGLIIVPGINFLAKFLDLHWNITLLHVNGVISWAPKLNGGQIDIWMIMGLDISAAMFSVPITQTSCHCESYLIPTMFKILSQQYFWKAPYSWGFYGHGPRYVLIPSQDLSKQNETKFNESALKIITCKKCNPAVIRFFFP